MPKNQEEILTEEHIEAQRQYAIAKMNFWTKMNNRKNKVKEG